MSDDMLDDMENAVADGSDMYEMYKGWKVEYINGVLKGNEALIKAFDEWEALTDNDSTSKIVKINGDFIWRLLERSNKNITEDEARTLATPEGTKEMAKIWWQKLRTAGLDQ